MREILHVLGGGEKTENNCCPWFMHVTVGEGDASTRMIIIVLKVLFLSFFLSDQNVSRRPICSALLVSGTYMTSYNVRLVISPLGNLSI
jgi:hypothetical protein